MTERPSSPSTPPTPTPRAAGGRPPARVRHLQRLTVTLMAATVFLAAFALMDRELPVPRTAAHRVIVLRKVIHTTVIETVSGVGRAGAVSQSVSQQTAPVAVSAPAPAPVTRTS